MSDLRPASIPALPIGDPYSTGISAGLGLLQNITKPTSSPTAVRDQTATAFSGGVTTGGTGSGQRGGYYANFGGGFDAGGIINSLTQNPWTLALLLGGAVILFFLWKRL